MARGHLRERLVSNVTGLPLGNAVVTVRLPGTGTATSVVLYKALTGTGAGTFWTNPITTLADGVIDFYVDVPDDFDLRVVAAGYPDTTIASVKAHYAQADLVDKTSAQTLTNKTLTSPTFSGTIVWPTPFVLVQPSTRNLTVTTLDGTGERLRVIDGITYMPGPLQMGTDLGWTSDPVHLIYLNKTVTGAWSQTTNIVDTFLVEVNGATSADADIGAVAGFARALTAAGVVSMRGLAGQMMIDAGAQKADREAAELGVHSALAVTSKADNRTTFDKMFGNVGALISAYSGTQADGNAAQRANSAIAINTYGGSGGHWKQFLVAWDVANTKAIQIDDQGNIVAGGGGNNAALPAYGFLDTVGDVDVGNGMFWAANDTIAWSINSAEKIRLTSDGLGINRTPNSGTSLSVQGAALFYSGAAGTNQFFQMGRTATDAQFVIAGGAGQYANEAAQGDFVLRAESGHSICITNGADGVSTLRIGASTLGFFGGAPVAKRSAYTQTYSTASRTHNNPAATSLTAASGTADGVVADVTASHNQGILNDNFQECVNRINNLVLDVANVKQVVNSLIDDEQAFSLTS